MVRHEGETHLCATSVAHLAACAVAQTSARCPTVVKAPLLLCLLPLQLALNQAPAQPRRASTSSTSCRCGLLSSDVAVRNWQVRHHCFRAWILEQQHPRWCLQVLNSEPIAASLSTKHLLHLYFSQRLQTAASHVLFFVVDANGQATLAVVVCQLRRCQEPGGEPESARLSRHPTATISN